MQKPDPLIRTKLRLPFIRSSLVSRPRLQARITEGLKGPLTLVVAPAGFGKTTLVVDGISTGGMRVAWLALDKDDNQPGQFLTYLIAALHEADQRIGNESAQLMAGMRQVSPEAVLTGLINDLDTVDAEIVLVVDDYQFIHSQAVHEQVAFLLEHCPGTFHLVITTRSDPPLPVARLRARGQIIELRASDLRFTADEVTQFLNDIMGLQLDAVSVAVLEERTEGWIAGLQMAALSMRGRDDVENFIQAFTGTDRFIMDFMLEEVLAREPEAVQSFLLQTAILTQLSSPLCDAVTGTLGSQEMLWRLESRNLFVVPLDSNGCWYRYHHLFADLLRARLYQSRPSVVHQLHIRASTWLEQNGFIAESIHQLLAAHENDRAADLIERYGPARLEESDPSVFQLADNLPSEMLIARPKIGLYRAWLFILQGRVEKAIPLLNDLERRLVAAGSNSGQQWILTIIVLAHVFLGRHTDASGIDPFPDYQALDEIPADEVILRDTADMLYVLTVARRGDVDRAVEVAVKCIQRKKTYSETLSNPTMILFLARGYLIQGRLHAAASLCREILDMIKKQGIRFIYSAGSMNMILGEVLYEWNCLEEAKQQIRDGLQANEPWVDIMTDAWGLLALTRVLRAKSDYIEAMQIVGKFETRLQGQLRPYEFEEDPRTVRVRLGLSNGDLQAAAKWAEQIQRSEDFRLHEERYRLTLAHIRMAQGRYGDVEKLLAGISPPPAAGNRITRQIESNLLLAAALAKQQRLRESFTLIESSLALAEPEGYIRSFLDVGQPAREILTAYLRSEASDYKPYAQKLLDAFSPANGTSSSYYQQGGLIEPLTVRELDVLHLMALGKTNQEIAQQLIVAPGTIKAHTASIYRKLDVANRTEAVSRARQLGILP